MVATYNFTNGSISGQMIPPVQTVDTGMTFVIRNIVDLTKQNLDHSATDIAQCLTIPAGTTVLTAWIRVITAGTTSATCTLGTGAAAAIWGTALDLTSTAGTILGHLFDPLYAAAEETVDITSGGATDILGKYEVCALCVKSVDTY